MTVEFASAEFEFAPPEQLALLQAYADGVNTYLAANRDKLPIEFVAIKDTYASSGRPDQLLERFGLTSKDIEQAVRSAVRK